MWMCESCQAKKEKEKKEKEKRGPDGWPEQGLEDAELEDGKKAAKIMEGVLQRGDKGYQEARQKILDDLAAKGIHIGQSVAPAPTFISDADHDSSSSSTAGTGKKMCVPVIMKEKTLRKKDKGDWGP